MRFQPTAVFLLCVLALAAFPAAAFGVTPETIGLGFVTAAAATFLVDRAPGAFRPSMMFQRGDIGAQLDEVAAQYEKVQADLTQVGQQLKNHADGVRAEIQTIEQRIAQHFQNGGGVIRGGDGVASVIMGEFAESPAFAHLQEGNAGSARVKFNGGIQAALLTDGMGTSSDGSLPRDPARLGFVPETLRPLRLLDVLPVIPTQRDSVEYTRLSSEGEASEQVQEGDEKAEIEFDGELIRNEIVTIAAHTTASKQVLSDHGQLQAAIDMVLRHKARARLENKIINGPGGSPRPEKLRYIHYEWYVKTRQ